MNKLTFRTKDLSDENYKKLVELFPNIVTETIDEDGNLIRAIDKNALMQEINTYVVDERAEKYQFTWPDKYKTIVSSNAPTSNTLRPNIEESKRFSSTSNLYIEGDNLEVLKVLRETYLGKIKCIYIDPPYNTGKDYIYSDNFDQKRNDYYENSGQVDELQNRLTTNTDSSGRYHTDWLNMMYSRLRVSKNLLSDDGIILISIDDNEKDNLKKICDEIFGEKNFVSNLVWIGGRKNDSRFISNSHEYILVYVKNIELLKNKDEFWRVKKEGLKEIFSKSENLYNLFGEVEGSKKLKIWFNSLPENSPAKTHKHYSNLDSRGPYYKDNISWPGGGGPDYEVFHPTTKKPVKKPSRGWLYKKHRLEELIKDNRVAFGKDENIVPTEKRYLKDTNTQVPISAFYNDNRGSMKRLRTLFDGIKIFDFPKDELIIKKILSIFPNTDDSIILDFFSGSATTAHAVMQLNAEDGGKRKFIMVQLPEETDKKSEAYKAGYKYITDIGKERIRRAGKKILEDYKEKDGIENLDVGFRVLKLDSSNMKDIYYSPQDTQQSMLEDLTDNIKGDRSELDLLFQVMLDLGVELSSTINEIEVSGKKIFSVSDNYLLATFDRDIDDKTITEIAKRKPVFFVMRDSSLTSDSVATNFEQIFNTYSPETTRRVL